MATGGFTFRPALVDAQTHSNRSSSPPPRTNAMNTTPPARSFSRAVCVVPWPLCGPGASLFCLKTDSQNLASGSVGAGSLSLVHKTPSLSASFAPKVTYDQCLRHPCAVMTAVHLTTTKRILPHLTTIMYVHDDSYSNPTSTTLALAQNHV